MSPCKIDIAVQKVARGATGLGHIRIYSKFEYNDERICQIRIFKRPIFIGRSSDVIYFYHYGKASHLGGKKQWPDVQISLKQAPQRFNPHTKAT